MNNLTSIAIALTLSAATLITPLSARADDYSNAIALQQQNLANTQGATNLIYQNASVMKYIESPTATQIASVCGTNTECSTGMVNDAKQLGAALRMLDQVTGNTTFSH